ncbi:hypothetical protein CERSUDRAFT_116640 [Gelatoporia subvermispora B]|uniref:Uncharacterized protein n=1 Tax=Ceriporiopsis subvermispora (strain B) TaxID=914234 RepID=M2PGN4_CERS8|nr:hypothetical protein CERSUDRAFT_116640 [Gelatoporia subvermispora B]
MDESVPADGPSTPGRGRGSRGSHKPRGGLGKYLRARGRGRGRGGRPAEWGQRLVLEGEEQVEQDEEEAQELQQKYARRQLGSNADRYVEPEPELDSGGEEVVEPEVDLSSFLERQRISDAAGPSSTLLHEEDDDVDHSLDHLIPRAHASSQNKKGKVTQIEWDARLEEMSREKAAAEAKWDLKARFRAQTANQRGKPSPRGKVGSRSQADDRAYVEAPPLPSEPQKPLKTDKEGMEDFLDDLLG